MTDKRLCKIDELGGNLRLFHDVSGQYKEWDGQQHKLIAGGKIVDCHHVKAHAGTKQRNQAGNSQAGRDRHI
ncbi:hypothetical protein SDC9_197984 [bioreactor metagenome]|uniref:Uncharacterized protein n=1 Tax=bioreactor metagenome TaxID=1076179 RepID=A0A645IGC2_9ZZZZ